jgi:hypothetical protein
VEKGTEKKMKNAAMVVAASAIVLLFAIGPARPQEPSVYALNTGNDLMDLCSDKNNDIRLGECIGYIRGVGDTMNMLDGIWVNVNPPTNRQLVDVILKYLRDYPATRNSSAAAIVMRALQKAFPSPFEGPKHVPVIRLPEQ